MEYIILDSKRTQSLTELVNEYIAKGWVPQGGVSLAVAVDTSFYYAQAMIKITK